MNHWTSCKTNSIFLFALLFGAALPAGAENVELRKQLVQIDSLRAGEKTPFDEVEKQCAELLKIHTAPEDQASIYFELAHVYAQSNIGLHPDRVTEYANKALATELGVDRRATLFTYLGSAAEVDGSRKSFPEKRRAAAEQYLKGYQEVLAIGLPEEAPELPAVNIYESDGFNPVAANRHQTEVIARRKAEFTRTMIQHRDILRRQIVELYRRQPADDDELRQLANKVFDEEAVVDGLITAVDAPAAAR